MMEEDRTLQMTADVISAYVQNHTLSGDELSTLIRQVHYCFMELKQDFYQGEHMRFEHLQPAVDPAQSVTDDYIICLEDGKKFKSLRRHLKTHYNLTPEQYRKKWNLDVNYPMVAPNYASVRSNLARKIGLGRKIEK